MEHGALDLNNVVFSYFDLNLECFDQPELRIYIDVEFWIENNTGLLNKVKIFIILSVSVLYCWPNDCTTARVVVRAAHRLENCSSQIT